MRCEGVDWRSSVAHSERNALYTHGCRGAERRSQWGKLAEVQRIPQANLLVLSLFGAQHYWQRSVACLTQLELQIESEYNLKLSGTTVPATQ